MSQVRYPYYVRQRVTSIDDFWRAIFPLTTIALCGARLPSEDHIRVKFTVKGEDCLVYLHTKLGDYIDPFGPYRKGTFIFGGKDIYNVQEIWVILEVNLSNIGDMANTYITVSPVPFGLNGKPMLPKTPGLKSTINYLFTVSNRNWSVSDLISKIRDVVIKAEDPNPGHILNDLQTLGITEQEGDVIRVIMDSRRFEDIFGLNLPMQVFIIKRRG
jgi:hypothetical protein